MLRGGVSPSCQRASPAPPQRAASGRTFRVCFSRARSLSRASCSWPLWKGSGGHRSVRAVSALDGWGRRDVRRAGGGRTSASLVASGTSSATSLVKSRSCLRGANPDMAPIWSWRVWALGREGGGGRQGEGVGSVSSGSVGRPSTSRRAQRQPARPASDRHSALPFKDHGLALSSRSNSPSSLSAERSPAPSASGPAPTAAIRRKPHEQQQPTRCSPPCRRPRVRRRRCQQHALPQGDASSSRPRRHGGRPAQALAQAAVREAGLPGQLRRRVVPLGPRGGQ